MTKQKTNAGILLGAIFILYGNMLLMLPPMVAAFFEVPGVPLLPFTLIFVVSLIGASVGLYMFGRDWVK